MSVCETDLSAGAASLPHPSRSGFLFSPAIDLFFIANAFWPLLLLVDRLGGIATHQSLLFWQIYFVTAPHRWITLILVTVDHHKGIDRRRQFLAFGTAILIACLCLKMGTGSLLCLGVIDYIWNAWHFASQHHGVFRIYQRKSKSTNSSGTSGPTRFATTKPLAATLEKAVFRCFMLYVIARVAGWGWSEGPFDGFQWVSSLDWGVLVVPVAFAGRQCFQYAVARTVSLASVAYLTSVMTLFASLLLASHFENNQWVVQLALASAIFHSLEYMSIVTWSMSGSRGSSQANALARLSKMWLLFLVIFVVVIGLGNYLLSRGYFELWVFVNIVVAFWHYCFDGMIWKSRKPSSASKPSPAIAS
ncbi:putative membrane protein [Rhodopirellula maiorica SM1]|uniref:Putative membrane protein n=1 Tax=Rhodopirellula maiorica SM1 TaxID=1265738 RepID=M5RPV9_9BACT|nr:hypothetical protein [Rhodopirellula maiorica]EMI16004.1 putative membrane protein [Rhodopirellula maiorica SM1]